VRLVASTAVDEVEGVDSTLFFARRQHQLGTRSYTSDCFLTWCEHGAHGGNVIGPVAAGTRTIVFSVRSVTAPPPCDPDCPIAISGGFIARLEWSASGRLRFQRLAGTPAAGLLAVASGRIADVPLAADGSLTRTLELRSADDGTLRWSVTLPSPARAVALDGGYVVALAGTSLIWYHVGGGEAGHVDVSTRARELDVSNGRAVYASRAIHVVDLSSSQNRRLFAPRSRPAQLSIAGRRVAWVPSPQGATVVGVRLRGS
jgi:hypothetical protein